MASRAIFSAIAILALSGCGGGAERQKADAGTQRAAEAQALEAKAREMLADVMFDPAAIQLKDLQKGSDSQGRLVICGQVNAKNRDGGYIGFRPFVARRNEKGQPEIYTDAASGAEAALYRQNFDQYCAPGKSARSDATKAPVPETAPSPTGTITGATSFPSDHIPKDMKICARNTATRESKCIVNGSKPSYKMSLAPGTYLVWAETREADGKAFYSKFVVCGVSVECPSHDPIEVKVEAGRTVSKIDPGDWYVPQ